MDQVIPGVTAAHLARESGVPYTVIAKVLGGWQRLTPRHARALAKVINSYRPRFKIVRASELME